ncbi:signal transduction histidine kinase [Kribbella steppae]|uniref:histidine kinase n=1 Tax=Kribbella steppae TaxID=2512223 RepID=A0A4R2HQK3_9ACTN|nr:sensor histidine kinase [Kribbella steppae]TCO33474.1 signal transduction histidine kinase [Kribbella steppae]
MGAFSRWCRDLRVPPVLQDCGLALVILVLNMIVLGQRQHGQVGLTVSGASLVIAAAVAMVFRRRAPVVVLGLTTALGVTFTITQQAKSPIGLFMACSAYMVVLQTDRRTRASAIVSVVAATVVAAAVYTDGELFANLVNGLVVLFGAAIGEATRYRRAYLQELEERAMRAEQSRDEEAQRRVIEERLRIAHELHDVIAHHIALMNVQSGVAAHVLRTQPEEAERALSLVREGGRTVLQELTVLLGVLRRSGTSLPTAPTPSLHEVGALVDSFAAAGVKVDWQLPDSLGPLPDVIELTAYRIVQESLTNVLKHAPGAAAKIRLSRRAGALTIDITNTASTPGPAAVRTATSTTPPGAGAAPSGPALSGASPSGVALSSTPLGAGHGLLGMRERVEAVGGELRTGPEPGGGFGVHAVLPLETGVVGDDPGAAGRRSDADPQRVPGAGELSTRFGGRC